MKENNLSSQPQNLGIRMDISFDVDVAVAVIVVADIMIYIWQYLISETDFLRVTNCLHYID